jgi:trk system potassium uptake protein TrkH
MCNDKKSTKLLARSKVREFGTEMRNRVFANLGFLLQITGLLTVLPIGIGLYFDETQHVVALFLACVGFLAAGFLMNALCERRDLDFKSASVLLLAAFIMLPLIGAIPYIYQDPFNSPNLIDKFTNGYFESISGFTTTGFSFMQNSDILPRSLFIYRSLTELMGGVGIVFLLLAFFQSRRSLNHLGNTLGIEAVNGNLKRMFFSVLIIYSAYITVFIAVFYFLGFQDLIKTGSFVIDTITGGFQPSIQQVQQYLTIFPKTAMIILMLVGSVNFAFNYHLFTLKLKKALSLEVVIYLLMIVAGTGLILLFTQIEPVDSLFHVVSMSSSTGYDYINIPALNETSKSILIVIMLIGGCAFSMAGGIRISRIITFAKSVKESIKGILIKEKVITEQTKKAETNNIEHLSALVSIVLFISTLTIFSIIFSTIGVSFTNALFEMGSALTTNGISMGATTVTMPLAYKWLMIVAMTVGRVEIISVIIALSPYKAKE